MEPRPVRTGVLPIVKSRSLTYPATQRPGTRTAGSLQSSGHQLDDLTTAAAAAAGRRAVR
jgi:hypothetical protein